MATFVDEKMAVAKLNPSEALAFVTSSPIDATHWDLRAANRSSTTNTVTQVETRVNNCVSNDEFNRRLSYHNGKINSMANDTGAATEAENKMTFIGGVSLYPKAMAWSILLSLTLVMEEYDTALSCFRSSTNHMVTQLPMAEDTKFQLRGSQL